MIVYLIGSMRTNVDGIADFLTDHKLQWSPTEDAKSGSEQLVELGGRVCYMSYGKGRKTNAEYIGNLIGAGHGSVLEHAVYTMLIAGVSRSLTHELVRHRHFSFSQLSQRYVDESEAEMILPDAITASQDLSDTALRSVRVARTAYKILVNNLELVYKDVEDKTLRRKMARQAARSVLPNATETKIVVTGNARAWRHFLKMRGSIHADPEIRRLAVMCFTKLSDESPNLFKDFNIDADGCLSTDREV